LSLLTPFAAFLLAQTMHCSGVVAVVASALVLAYSGPVVIRARSRLQAFAFWDIATFLINGSLWVFVGVQIPSTIRGISGVDGGVRHAALIALAVATVVIVSRIFWTELTTAFIRLIDRREVQRARRVNWRQRLVTAWAGFRGAVSLAAALAIPTTTLSGAPFPDRSMIIFIVTIVILVTVLVGGSTLPLVIRWARMPDDVAYAEEVQLARSRGIQAALDALPVVATELGASPKMLDRLKKEYEEHAALVMENDDGSATGDLAKRNDLVKRVRLGVLEHKRREITALRNQRVIDDIVLRELQAEMDLEEAQLLGPTDGE
jgi:CPA1 family monovalent cation:H+ antiporter